jgi:hypothetical protein
MSSGSDEPALSGRPLRVRPLINAWLGIRERLEFATTGTGNVGRELASSTPTERRYAVTRLATTHRRSVTTQTYDSGSPPQTLGLNAPKALTGGPSKRRSEG